VYHCAYLTRTVSQDMLQSSDELQGMKRNHTIIMIGCQQQSGRILGQSKIRYVRYKALRGDYEDVTPCRLYIITNILEEYAISILD
jgi:hypothetical protein